MGNDKSKKPKKDQTMSLSPEREQELDAIADTMYALDAEQRDEYNGYYNPDIFLCGHENLEESSSEDIATLASDTTGLSHEEIEFLASNLKNRGIHRYSIGIRPGSKPPGSPSGNK